MEYVSPAKTENQYYVCENCGCPDSGKHVCTNCQECSTWLPRHRIERIGNCFAQVTDYRFEMQSYWSHMILKGRKKEE